MAAAAVSSHILGQYLRIMTGRCDAPWLALKAVHEAAVAPPGLPLLARTAAGIQLRGVCAGEQAAEHKLAIGRVVLPAKQVPGQQAQLKV